MKDDLEALAAVFGYGILVILYTAGLVGLGALVLGTTAALTEQAGVVWAVLYCIAAITLFGWVAFRVFMGLVALFEIVSDL